MGIGIAKNDNVLRLLDVMKPLSKTDYKEICLVTEPYETNLYNVIFSKKVRISGKIYKF